MHNDGALLMTVAPLSAQAPFRGRALVVFFVACINDAAFLAAAFFAAFFAARYFGMSWTVACSPVAPGRRTRIRRDPRGSRPSGSRRQLVFEQLAMHVPRAGRVPSADADRPHHQRRVSSASRPGMHSCTYISWQIHTPCSAAFYLARQAPPYRPMPYPSRGLSG